MDILENTVSINGIVVKKVHAGLRGGIDVYKPVSEHEYNTLFYVKGTTLLFTQHIKADCCQNEGFVEEVSFRNSTVNPTNG